MAAVVNKSFASPAANAEYPTALDDVAGGLLARVYNGVSGTSIVITVVLMLIAYDQCELFSSERDYTIVIITVVNYIWNKGSIVGPAWKTPFFGPFLESVYPDMNRYKEKWASGELSCVSVFHKYGHILHSDTHNRC